MEVVWQVRPAFLQASFDAIDREHGGVVNYLSGAVGMQANELQRLRQALLEY